MAIPTPADADQRRLLQSVWDLCVAHSKWPTFTQVDRKLDRDFGLDAHAVGEKLPTELLYPPLDRWVTPNQELCLTVAGVMACSGSEEDVRYFIDVVRVAAEVERSWPGRPLEDTDDPILRTADALHHVQFPAAGREALLTRLGLLLAVERWGWKSAGTGGPDWQFVLGREVRRFRAVRDLDQYWSIRTRQTEPTSPARSYSERESMTTADKIFISHASADRKLADLLRDALVLGGVPQKQFFYSSSRATGIPSGTNVRLHLRDQLLQAGLVIELISKTFLIRPMCLIELGGAWVLGKSTYPIVVPPLTRTDAATQIGDINMAQLGSDEEIDNVFDELNYRLANDVELSLSATEWNPAVRKFKAGLPAVLTALTASAAPPAVMPSASPSASAPSSQEKLTVSNYIVVPTNYGTEVHGEATNNDTIEHGASLKATFYNEEEKIVGTADGLVNQLAPGDMKTFTLISTNSIPKHTRVKVQVDTIF